MISFLLACTLLSLITSVLSAGHNNSREFLLRTQLKPGQPRKTRFDGLYLETYHTGAGFNDAVFSWQKNANSGSHFYLNGTELDAEFDDEYIWSMQPAPNANFYASWEPVRINAIGEGAAGFSISRTGLEWESDPSQGQTVFLGWFVCSWWHNLPQLFFKIAGEQTGEHNPLSCADINLIPEYI